MTARWKVWLTLAMAGVVLGGVALWGQDAAPGEPPPLPKGIEVMTRGPVHEAFASLTAEPVAAPVIPKQPPKPIEEMPPEEKPEGDVIWISGYWAYDDERKDFLWVSGLWRAAPPGRQWVAGYWREAEGGWQWVPGFWTAAAKEENATQEVTYLPEPPKPPVVAPPGPPPNDRSFYVPGVYVWNGTGYAWRAGYWARVEEGYVWVPAHYRWTPGGYIFIDGYWDLAVKRRGMLYAPVYISPSVVTVGYYYTPTYAVSDTVVVDTLFVRPAYCAYYFGDYYGPAYRDSGYVSCVVYSERNYDSIIVYERYEHRSDPNWLSLQINVSMGRDRDPDARPPRSINQTTNYVVQNTYVNNSTTVINNSSSNTTINNNITNNVNRTTTNNTFVAPAKQIAAAKGVKTVPLDTATRTAAKQQAAAVQQVALQRSHADREAAASPNKGAKVAALSVPKAQPVAKNMTVPKPPPTTPPQVRPATTPVKPQTGPVNPAHPQNPQGPGNMNPTHPGTTPGHPGTDPAHPGTTPGHPGVTPVHPGTAPGQPGTTPGQPARPGSAPPGSTQPGHAPPPGYPAPPPQNRPAPPNQKDKDKDHRDRN